MAALLSPPLALPCTHKVRRSSHQLLYLHVLVTFVVVIEFAVHIYSSSYRLLISVVVQSKNSPFGINTMTELKNIVFTRTSDTNGI